MKLWSVNCHTFFLRARRMREICIKQEKALNIVNDFRQQRVGSSGSRVFNNNYLGGNEHLAHLGNRQCGVKFLPLWSTPARNAIIDLFFCCFVLFYLRRTNFSVVWCLLGARLEFYGVNYTKWSRIILCGLKRILCDVLRFKWCLNVRAFLPCASDLFVWFYLFIYTRIVLRGLWRLNCHYLYRVIPIFVSKRKTKKQL